MSQKDWDRRINSKNQIDTKVVISALGLLAMLLLYSSAVVALNSSNYVISSSGSIGSISPLHINGRYVKDNQNRVVALRGANYARFIDSPYGDWQLQSGLIKWANWDVSAAETNLNEMRSWGINAVRTLSTIEWWWNNTGNHRQIIKDWAAMAALRGMYVVYGFWRVTGTSAQPGLPYPPYDSGYSNTIITSSSDFVNLWVSVAHELKNYPNVLFELWNEPTGDTAAEDSWFSVVQECITAIRGTGATNIIVVQWGFCVGVDYSNYNYYNSGGRAGPIWTTEWINQYALNDTLGNILYSTHLYRNAFYDSAQNYMQIANPLWKNYTQDDLSWGLNITGVTSTSKPLWIGEIGPNQWASDLDNEYSWYNSTLSLLNRAGVGYTAWWWWVTGTAWGHLVGGAPNFLPNRAGEILRQRIGQ